MRYLGMVLLAGLGLSFQEAVSQTAHDFASYSQPIPGTELKIEMTPVAGGEFRMGSPKEEPGREEDEGPQRVVAVDSFWMGTYEITWDQYEAFLDKTKIGMPVSGGEDLNKSAADAVTRPSPPYEDPSFGMGKSGGFPAVSMTQYAALTFCKWLSAITGELYRLPTEAEWEYACRAGSTGAYSFGNDAAQLNEYAWYYENSDGKYHQVGQKKPNAWGLYDMHGNVAEWTLDQYYEDFYARSKKNADVNPWAAPTDLEPRSVRGGSYDDDPEWLRCAERLESNPEVWKGRDPQFPKSFWWNTDSPFVGFRIVRPAKKMTSQEIRDFWNSVLDEQ